MRILTWLLTNAVALAVATWLVDGIRFTGPVRGQAEIEHKIVPLLVVAAILGVVNALVKPVITFLSIPFILLTLGLFLLIINAGMLELTAWISREVGGLGFRVESFGAAVLGALVITVATWVVDGLIGSDDR